jgi:hypothetical protein
VLLLKQVLVLIKTNSKARKGKSFSTVQEKEKERENVVKNGSMVKNGLSVKNGLLVNRYRITLDHPADRPFDNLGGRSSFTSTTSSISRLLCDV